MFLICGECNRWPKTAAQAALNRHALACWGRHSPDACSSLFFQKKTHKTPQQVAVVLFVCCLDRWSILTINSALVVEESCQKSLQLILAFSSHGKVGGFFHFFKLVVTGCESWVSGYDPKVKSQFLLTIFSAMVNDATYVVL